MLSAATDAWQKEGYEVIGTAVPGATAMRLQADTKSDQGVTADSLITSIRTRTPRPRSQHRDRARRGRRWSTASAYPSSSSLRTRPAPSSSLPATPRSSPRSELVASSSGWKRKVPTAELHRGAPCASRVGARSVVQRSERANPDWRSRATRPTTASTSTTPVLRPPRRWSRTGIRTARACRRIRP